MGWLRYQFVNNETVFKAFYYTNCDVQAQVLEDIYEHYKDCEQCKIHYFVRNDYEYKYLFQYKSKVNTTSEDVRVILQNLLLNDITIEDKNGRDGTVKVP